MIPTYPAISRLHRVPVPHTNDAVYALTADGRRWIAKREADMGFEALLAEAVAWLLGRLIGVRAPDAAFCDDPAERAWLGACIPDVSHWFPAPGGVANAAEVGAMLAIDAWMLNEARHSRNILAEGPLAGAVRLWAIDADEALVGHIDDYIARLGDVPSVHNHARGLPIGELASATQAAARRTAGLPVAEVRERVEAACTLAREPRAGELADAAIRRAGAFPDIVEHYLRDLQALQ